jgi:hypothetical protein
MFTIFTSGRLFRTQSRAATTSLVQQNALFSSSTFTATMLASGAVPLGATVPREVTIPLTWVPCPWSSSGGARAHLGGAAGGTAADPLSEQKQASPTRSSPRSGWSWSIPESITATVTPAPV